MKFRGRVNEDLHSKKLTTSTARKSHVFVCGHVSRFSGANASRWAEAIALLCEALEGLGMPEPQHAVGLLPIGRIGPNVFL